MKGKTLYWTGLLGFIVTAICCFTPVLVVTMTSLGLAGLTGLIDIVLLPPLAVFALMFVVGLRARKTAQ